jgi:6-phosphofructokinase 1
MAGYSDILIGLWNGRFTHVPLVDTVDRRRTLDPDGWLWQSVLYSTGQTHWNR